MQMWFEVLVAIRIDITVFWELRPQSCDYMHVREMFQQVPPESYTMQMEATEFFETSVSTYESIWRYMTMIFKDLALYFTP